MKSIEEVLKSLNYDFEEIGTSVFLVKNFFTEKDFEPIWQIINTSEQSDWEKDYRDSQIDLAMKKFGRSDLDALLEEGLMEYTDSWHDKAVSITHASSNKISYKLEELFKLINNDLIVGGFSTIQRQYEGSPLVEHVDDYADPYIAYAAIGYINDDYSNGELYFSKLGIKIKPPAKSLIIFPSGEMYSHGVNSPGPGPIRYALPSFIYKNI